MATRVIQAPFVVTESVVRRFDTHQRIQHFLMMSTFLLLAFTGLPLKFHDLAVSQWWIALWGDIENTRSVHHIAAWVMVFDCLYHMAYIFYGTLVLKRPLPLWMFPNLKDLQDLIHELRYYFGLAKEKPDFDRFNWHEKFDYWAVFWGIPIMAGSGFVLMYPILVAKYLPGVLIPIALVAHSDEAVLAVSWIFIVHFFFAHLAPHVFPINTSIFTGRVSAERYKKEHPLEWEREGGSEGDVE